jgi:hypothetical protein
MVLLTSDKGTGKSNAAIVLAREWCKLIGIRFDPERHLAYTNANVMDKIDKLRPFEPIVCISGDSKIKIKYNNIEYEERIDNLINMKNYEVLTYNIKINKFEYKIPEKTILQPIKKNVILIKLENNKTLKITNNHLILTKEGYKKIKDLTDIDEIKTTTEFVKIKNIKTIKNKIEVYDIINISDNHNFVANNIVIHNCDEAVKFASSADWAKKESKQLKEKLAQVRTKHLLFILCFPLKIMKIEKNYLESFVNYWCLTGDTKIITRDKTGMQRSTQINKLNKHNPEVLTYNKNTKKFEFKTYDKQIKTKIDAEIFELELENGQTIKCTDDHPFLTQRGWVRLKDLKQTDKIETYTKKCKYCNKNFEYKKINQIFCSKKCSSAFHARSDRQYLYNKQYRQTHKEQNKQISNQNYYNNHSKRLLQAKTYRKKNRETINKKASIYRQQNRVLLRERDKKYREQNHEKYLEYKRSLWKKYRKNNLNFKLRENLRNALRRVLNAQNTKKTHPIFKYLGCSIEEFKEYISKQFVEGMSWDSWGKDTWNIDHIKPCSHFDLTKESERFECFNYKNQQPMWAPENWSKGDRYVG